MSTGIQQSVASVSHPGTLTELLRCRATHQPDRVAYTFLKDGEADEVHLTYAELDRRARAIGARLQQLGATAERVLLLYPSGLDYIAAFFGCLYAGAIAVPAYPPRFNRTVDRIEAIVDDARATVALTTTALLSKTDHWFVPAPALATLHWLATDTLDDRMAETWQEAAIDSDTLAFLQYTSGSTGTPKGVMVSHGNLLDNIRLLQSVGGHTEESSIVGWLPLYHDMGLIGTILLPLYVGCVCILMSPLAFLQRPLRWLQAMSRYRATSSTGPNFAYDLCVRKIRPEQRATLDLSSWEMACNAAEPIRQETLDRFVQTFAPCGFRREAFYPCYGLAEATLIVSGGLKTDPPVAYTVQKTALEQHQVALACIGSGGVRTLVGCGQALSPQQTIVIVDPESRTQCPPHRVGEIWVSGPSVAQGYWNRPDETAQTFGAYLADTGDGPFLRTGDLGFLHHGELFVTGRLKDVLIIRGNNHYPQDIELTVAQSHAACRPGGGAAFSVDIAGEERLVVAQEVERHYRPQHQTEAHPGFEPTCSPPFDLDALVGNIRQAVTEQHGIQPYAVVLLRSGSIPKTSSGKIQRYACRAGFLNQSLSIVGQWQAPLGPESGAPAAPSSPNGRRQEPLPSGVVDPPLSRRIA